MRSTYIHNNILTQSIQMAFFLYLSSLVLRIGLLQSLTVLKVDFVLKIATNKNYIAIKFIYFVDLWGILFLVTLLQN